MTKQPLLKANKPRKQKQRLRLAINGFGRIGRNLLRAMLERNALDDANIQLVAINDIAEIESLIHLLNFDSTHGRLSAIGYIAELITTPNRNYLSLTHSHTKQSYQIEIFQQAQPKQLPWQALQIDVVLECSGYFRSYSQANQHRQAGAKQVIIGSAPFDDVDACIVMGINHDLLTLDLPIISSVSCTTQALVPLIATLDKAFGVRSVMMTEIHAVTADQNVLDQAHRDLRRARASGYNIIPTTSSSIRATERVLPNMTGKINGHSLRIPTINVASIDVTFTFDTQVDIDTLRQRLKVACKGELLGIMGYSDEPLVSSDFIHQPESLIIDGLQLMQVGEQFKIFAWYDNEWGYANRLLDMCVQLANA